LVSATSTNRSAAPHREPRFRKIHDTLQAAQTLLQENVPHFTGPDQFQLAHSLLQSFMDFGRRNHHRLRSNYQTSTSSTNNEQNTSSSNHVDLINYQFQLMEHVVQEVSAALQNEDSAPNPWTTQCQLLVCDTNKFLNPLMFRWKHAVIRSESTTNLRVATPRQVWSILRKCEKALPQKFYYDCRTVTMIMDVMCKINAPSRHVEQLFVNVWKRYKNREKSSNHTSLKPDAYMCACLMQSWAQWKSIHTTERMWTFVRKMQKHRIAQNHVTYNILLFFLSQSGAVDQIESVLYYMKKDGVSPTIAHWTQVVYGYKRAGQFEKAEEYLDQILQQAADPNQCNSREQQSIVQCIQTILLGYRSIITNSLSKEKQSQYVDKAWIFFQKILQHHATILNDDDKSTNGFTQKTKRDGFVPPFWSRLSYISVVRVFSLSVKITGTMMDIFARVGQVENAEMIAETNNPVHMSLLIKAHGAMQQPLRATEILRAMIDDCERVPPSVDTFNTVINCWAETSKSSEAFDQAFSVLKMMDDPRLKSLEIRPDLVTFHTMMKCLGSGNVSDKKSLLLVEEMERYPDLIVHGGQIYAKVIRNALKENDPEAAKNLLYQMNSFGVPIMTSVIVDVIQHLSSVGTLEAIEESESFIAKLRAMKNSSWIPDAHCYTALIQAWANSKTPNATDGIWKTYLRMVAYEIKPNIVTFSILLKSLSESSVLAFVEKSETILMAMNNSGDVESFPDHRHFSMVIRGFLEVGELDSAERVLMESVRAYVDGDNVAAHPNSEIIDAVVQGWINKGELERAHTLMSDFQKLKDDKVIPMGPHRDTYQSLLDAMKNSLAFNKVVLSRAEALQNYLSSDGEGS
jgi:pentatricopeptide repeat protein